MILIALGCIIGLGVLYVLALAIREGWYIARMKRIHRRWSK